MDNNYNPTDEILDDEYYEARAVELGVSLDLAKLLDREERAAITRQKEEAEHHRQELERQSNEFQKTFPLFNLQKELNNPIFEKLTSSDVKIDIETAYYATHYKELLSLDDKEKIAQNNEELRNFVEQKKQNHLNDLEYQTQRLKYRFHNLDLYTELQNPVFARMTSPDVGLSVEDAYCAVHHKEIIATEIQKQYLIKTKEKRNIFLKEVIFALIITFIVITLEVFVGYIFATGDNPDDIYSDGYSAGYSEGYDDGVDNSYLEGYVDGFTASGPYMFDFE